MSDVDFSVILDPEVTKKLVTHEQELNYLREQSAKVRAAIHHRPPPPTDEVSSVQYLMWERKMLMLYGRAMGALLAFQALGRISVAEMKILKDDLMAVLLRRAARYQLDGS